MSMFKEIYKELSLVFGAVGTAIGAISFVASLSITTISVALFWAAVAVTTAMAVAFPTVLIVAARRDPEMKVSMVVKPCIDAFFLPLIGAAFLLGLGYEDREQFGLVQAIGAVLVFISVSVLGLFYVDNWLTRHKKCESCKQWNVAQAIRCKECGGEEFAAGS